MPKEILEKPEEPQLKAFCPAVYAVGVKAPRMRGPLQPRTGPAEFESPIDAVPANPPNMIALTGEMPTNNYSYFGIGQLQLPANNYQDVFLPVQVGRIGYTFSFSTVTGVTLQVSLSGDSDYWAGNAMFQTLTPLTVFYMVTTPIHIARFTNTGGSPVTIEILA